MSNTQPIVANPLPDQTVTPYVPFGFTFDVNTFTDSDLGDELFYEVVNSPSWLDFDSITRIFKGNPLGEIGKFSIEVKATDLAGDSVTDSFDLTVANSAPTVVNPMPDQEVKLYGNSIREFSFTLPSNTFGDSDPGDFLSYELVNSYSSSLSSSVYLSFDSITRTFSGYTPWVNGSSDTFSFEVKATDLAGESVTETFDLTFTNENTAPIVFNPIGDQTLTTPYEYYSFSIPGDTFIDLDPGDQLTYELVDPPSWLSSSGGNPLSIYYSGYSYYSSSWDERIGTFSIDVRATDSAGATVTDTFDLIILNNDPIVANPIPDQTITPYESFSLTVYDTFADPDRGDLLDYELVDPPEWLSLYGYGNYLSFSASYYGLDGDDIGTYSIEVKATDQAGATVTDTFDITVTNNAPTVANPIGDQTVRPNGYLSLYFSDVFTDPDQYDLLDYELVNGPEWLSFSGYGSNINFSAYSLDDDDIGTYSIEVKATDQAGESVSDTFNLIIASNAPPTVANPIPDQIATPDETFTFTFAADSFQDSDLDDNLYYNATLEDGSILPSGLTFHSDSRTFIGESMPEGAGPFNIKVTATDQAIESISDTFELKVTSSLPPTTQPYTGPVLVNPIPDQTVTSQSWNGWYYYYSLPSDTFAYPDYSISYELVNAPEWLSLFGSNLSGSPGFDDEGTYSIEVKATDSAGRSVTDSFDLTFANTAPTVTNPIPDQTITPYESFSLSVYDTFADPDRGDSLSYEVVDPPEWLSFSGYGSLYFSTSYYGLDADDIGTYSIEVKATDQAGATVTDTFDITVANNAPTVTNPIPDQTVTVPYSSFSFSLPYNTFTDPDLGDSLSYEVVNYPDFLYNSSSGSSVYLYSINSIGVEDIGTYSIEIIATDSAGESVSDSFDLIIANIPPTVINPLPDQTVTANTPFRLPFPSNTFTESDPGDWLSYELVNSPDWLFIDSWNNVFEGSPGVEDTGTFTVEVKATDRAGQSVTDSFDITIIDDSNSNTPPIVANPIADQAVSPNVPFGFAFDVSTFADSDKDDSLTYTATLEDGSLLSSVGLSFDPMTRTFIGEPMSNAVGPFSIKVTATDMSGESVSDIFDLTVTTNNSPPTVANPIPDKTAAPNLPFSFTFDANTFTDSDIGDILTYAATLEDGSSLSSIGMFFEEETRSFISDPMPSSAGPFSIKVTATDMSGENVSDTFDLAVINNAPTVAQSIANRIVAANRFFNFTFSANTFTDVDLGDTLTYTATLEDGSPLSSIGLNFDPNTRSFYGSSWSPGTFGIKVTATDMAGESVSDMFDLIVNRPRVFDGYIAGAVVFFDGNKNGVLDDDELSTTTDASGTYDLEISEIFDTNGNGQLDPSEGSIVAIGGVDTAHGLPLLTPLTATPDATVVNLLTSLVADLVDRGLTVEEANGKVRDVFSLPSEVDLNHFDPIFATNNNEPGGVETFTAMVQVQNFITQTWGLISGASALSNEEIVKEVVAAITSEIQSSATLDLTDATQLETIILDGASSTNVDVSSIVSQAAQVMAEANQGISDIAATSPADSIEVEFAKVQKISLGETTSDLTEVTAGTKTIAEVVAENTGAALDDQIANAQVQSAAPTDLELSNTTVAENQPIGTEVGTFSTIDPDAGETHSYSLVPGEGDTDNDSFEIVDNRLRTSETFDYETQDAYNIRVQTTDGNGGVYWEQFTINVIDVNETSPGNPIEGTPSRDNLVGTSGDDIITGFQGRDTLTGGAGSDQFVYTSILDAGDIITDFEVGSDKIVIADVLDSFGYTGTDPIADGYIGFQPHVASGDTIITIDPDGPGSGRARSLIRVQNVSDTALDDLSNFVF